MPDTVAAERAIRAYRYAAADVRARTAQYLDAAWREVTIDLTDAAVERFRRRMMAAADGAQYRVGVLTDGYLAAYESAATGAPVRPTGLVPQDTATAALRGVPGEQVWQRPAVEVYTALSTGRTPPQALAQGLDRAHRLLETDLQLAHTKTSHLVLSRRRTATGFRRMSRGVGSCDLCTLAATHRYNRGNLLPIHDRCHCIVAPIFADYDPLDVLPEAELQRVRDVARREATDTEPVVHEHGEIGPYLSPAGQHFTGPAAVST